MTAYSFPIEISPLARWIVEFDYSPGSPGSMYRANGDPGDPPEPEEFEITDMKLEIRETLEALWVPVGVSLDESLANGDYIQHLCAEHLALKYASDQAERWEGNQE